MSTKQKKSPFVHLLKQTITSGDHILHVNKWSKQVSEDGKHFNITVDGGIDYEGNIYYTFAPFLQAAYRVRVNNYTSSILIDNKELRTYS